MTIFKGNDIRGIYGKELTDRDAYKIGKAFVHFLKCKSVVVARDHRISSPALTKAIISGIREMGSSVIDIGLIDSPGLYFASHMLNLPAIMVTASHNPPEHNGFYLCMSDARPIYKENGLKEIERLIQINLDSTSKKGTYKKLNVWKQYEKHVLSFLDTKKIKPIKVVIDAGNGMGSLIAKKVFSKIPQVKVIPMFYKLDGKFPNRGSDTSVPENLVKLQAKVKSSKADIGLAFDGDADRVSFVDEHGRFLDGSIVGTLITEYFIQNSEKKETIVYSSRCSRVLLEIIQKLKAQPIVERVGHSFMATRMREKNAIFGIEKTGHYFFKDNFYTESPMITSLLLLSILSSSSSSLSKLVKPLEKYYMTDEISFPTNKIKALDIVEQAIKEHYSGKIDKLDGLSVDLGNVWFSVRESQTESKIRVALEGKDKAEVEKQKIKLIKIVKEAIK